MFNSQRGEREGVAEIQLQALINEHDVARITGLSVATIRRRRLFHQPPKYYKLGSAVKYKPVDVEAWINSQPTGGGPNSEAA